MNSIESFWITVAKYLPNLISAIILLIVGKFVAKFTEKIVRHLLKSINFKGIGGVGKINKTLEKIGLSVKATDIIGSLTYWFVFLIFIMAAADILNMTVVVDTINSLIAYIPSVIATVVVFVLTIIVARLLKDIVETTLEHIQPLYAKSISNLSYWLLVFFGGLLAIAQLGLDLGVITTNLSIIIGGIIATLVIAIGLGSKDVVTNLLAGFYIKKILKVDEEVVLAGHKGRVVAIGDTSVTLKTAEGTMFIPNSVVVKFGSVK